MRRDQRAKKQQRETKARRELRAAAAAVNTASLRLSAAQVEVRQAEKAFADAQDAYRTARSEMIYATLA